MIKKEKKYSVKFRVWIEEGEERFLGMGRVMLLELIAKTGSITNAAKEMKMSYRQAWQFVEEMNKYAKEPLVEKILGGNKGGGARLTKAGEKAIKEFNKFENKVKEFVRKEFKKVKL